MRPWIVALSATSRSIRDMLSADAVWRGLTRVSLVGCC